MKLVNPIDQIFLRLEDRHQPMHVGGLQLFQKPRRADAAYVGELAAAAREFTDVRPPFNRRLRYRFGQPFWIDDARFDLEYHVRHVALPYPGAIRDLLALVSRLHGTPLDQTRPLWETYYIEGVTGERFAIYTKFHHALMDGVSAMRMVRAALDETADERSLKVPWQLPERRTVAREAEHEGTIGRRWKRLEAAGRQFAALPGAGSALVRTWRESSDPDTVTPLQAPYTMLNQRITGARRIAAQSYSLGRIKRLAAYYRATVNDVVLAMCASALRRYLIDHDALPAEPLVAMVPVSLHADPGEDYGEHGNRLAMIYAGLATHIAEPAARLATIQRSVNYWKRRYNAMSGAEIMAFVTSLSAPAGLNLLTGAAPRRQAFNVVISNVPGPRETLYTRDAELIGMYPLSLVFDGQALNITIISYRDSLEFGLVACRDSLPSVQRLLIYLADAVEELTPAAETTRPDAARSATSEGH